jgi:hypothetical protein
VKLGGRPFGELRPALAGATTSGRTAARSTTFGLADEEKKLLVPRLHPQADGTSSRANDVYRRTRRTAASQEGCQFPADDKGKEVSLLATFNV